MRLLYNPSRRLSVTDKILPLEETEKKISEENLVEHLIQQQNKAMQNDSIFPTCGNGEIFKCEDINLDEVLDESCKGILQFTHGTSSCSCQGKNDTAQKSNHILKQGWSKFTRYKGVFYLTLQ